MTIFLPASRVDRRSTSVAAATIDSGLAMRPSPIAPEASRPCSGSTILDAALGKRRQVPLRGWMVEHALFHRRSKDYWGGSREGDQTQQVVGETERKSGD